MTDHPVPGIDTFAKMLCKANHRRDFDNANPADSRVPCGAHIAEARSLHFLLTPRGKRSLGVLIELLPPSVVEYAVFGPPTPQVEARSAGADDVTIGGPSMDVDINEPAGMDA